MDREQIKKRLFFWYLILWFFIVVASYLSYAVYFVDTTSTKSKWVALFIGAIALLTATCKICEISFMDSKIPLFKKISKYFENGTKVFTNRTSRISLFIVSIVSLLLFKSMGINYVLSFIVGSIIAQLIVKLSSNVMAKVLSRVSQFYQESELVMYKQTFNSGIVIAFLGISFCLISLVILFHLIKDYQIINGFIFGICLVISINNVSISVSTRANDCASDIVVNHIAQIEKNDRRNPLLLLSGVTKGALNINLLSSDLLVSFVISIIAAMTVGGEFLQLMGSFLPLIIASSAVLASIICILLIKTDKIKNPIKNLFSLMFLSNCIFIAICFYLFNTWLPQYKSLVISIALGSFSGIAATYIHSNFIFNKYKSVTDVTNSAISGFLSTFNQVLKEGFISNIQPAIFCAIILVLAFLIPNGVNEPAIGLYGMTLCILGLISSVGVVIAIASFGLTTTKANNVINSYEEDIYSDNSIQKFDFEDCLLKLGKNFVNIASILSAISVFIAYTILAMLDQVDIVNPYVLISMLIGAIIPYFYCGLTMSSVSKTAKRLVLEVKRQFRKSPQILRNEIRPDFEKCVDVSALNSSINTSINLIIVFLIITLIALNLKIEALAGFIFAVILSSFGIIFMTSGSSNLVKTAKKFFETNFDYEKNIDEYNAINLSEEIYSSLRKLIIPALNSLVKFVAVLALSLLPLIM